MFGIAGDGEQSLSHGAEQDGIANTSRPHSVDIGNRQPSSVANRASNSVKFSGYSSISPQGLPESGTYPSN
jgi:hypothetical protein